MPCDSSGYSSSYDDSNLRKELDILTRLGCDLCSRLEQTTGVPEYAKEWYERHKKEDKLRVERDLQFAKEQIARQLALSKLTTQERSLLGLPI